MKLISPPIIFNRINIFSWINLATKLLVPVLILPVLFKNYQKDDSALWLYFLNMMSLAVFFDFGTISLQNRIYGYLQGKNIFFSKVYNTKFNFILIISSFFWFIIISLYLIFNGKGFFPIVCVGLCCNYMAIYIQNIIFSYGKIIESKNIESLMNIVRLLILTVLVLKKIDIILLLNFYYSYFILLFIVYLFALKKYCTNYTFLIASPNNLLSKYWKQVLSAWIATSFSSGMFYLSNIFLVDSFESHQWGNYMFSMRVIDMIVNISFVPFYSRIPQFINKYYKNERNDLLIDIKKMLILSIVMYILMSVVAYFIISIVFHHINTSTNLTSLNVLALISLSMLIFKVGASFLQISAFGNIVKWHKAILIQFIIILLFFSFLHFENIEFTFIVPFFCSLIFFLPYSFYLARKNF